MIETRSKTIYAKAMKPTQLISDDLPSLPPHGTHQNVLKRKIVLKVPWLSVGYDVSLTRSI